MNRYEKIAALGVMYVFFVVAFLNLILAVGGTVQGWQLPTSYVLFVAGIVGYRRWRGLPLRGWHLAVAALLPLAFALIAYGLHFTYDVSWDGQDYQQSGVIALAHGWNPWHQAALPISVPAGGEYVQGYPKAIWLMQAAIYKMTDQLQAAPVVNVVFAASAAIMSYGALRRLRISTFWSGIIAALAVLQIHFLQQLPTFMADGYSYQLALIAIAVFVLLIKEQAKAWPLAVICSVWLLLAGGKFSNLFVCALLGAAVAVYAWHGRLHKQTHLRWLVAAFACLGLLALWSPYVTNIMRYHSPVYPQNRPNESAKLRFDNVPNNLKSSNRPTLLFYGIFSATEPPDAGNPTSNKNVAELKWPFTYRSYEVREVNNFQGRVGSGGVLFSGIMVASVMLWIAVFLWRPTLRTPQVLVGTLILSALILIAALVIPVPNKLRYSPLITVLPCMVLVLLVSIRRASVLTRLVAPALALLIAANTSVAGIALVKGRIRDAKAIHSQLYALQQSGIEYEVKITSFYSHYLRLQDAGVRVHRVSQLSCSQPIALQASFNTTLLCPKH